MHAEQYRNDGRARATEEKEHKVDPMWAADEDERRMAIVRRAAAGAKRTLREQI